MEGEWEDEADDWIRWARTPGHDAYWFYRDAFFDHLLPTPGRRTLEVGCGEGRVARDLTLRGHHVIGLDTAATLVRAAVAEANSGPYLLADSAALPFPDGSFDLAVAYNALQVVADLDATVREIGRILEPGGHLAACVAHPVTDMGRFPEGPDGPFVLRPSYFDRTRVDEVVHQDGLSIRFQGWSYSLQDYATALEASGFQLQALHEPRPSLAPARYDRWTTVPLFLLVCAVKT